MSAPRQRAERSDALGNRAKLLDTAERLIAEHGIDVPMKTIAVTAGVGSATLYRNFAHHAELVRALYDRIVAQLDAVADACAATDGGWPALETYIDGATQILLSNPSASAIIKRQGANDPTYRPGAKWEEPLARYVAEAQAAGQLRTDVVGSDIALIPTLLSALAHFSEPMRSLAIARQRALLLDGLRPERASGPLSSAALTANDYHAMTHDQ